MPKIHYNDHLDDMLDRLMNEDLKTEELELELRRAKAVALITDKKIEHAKLVVKTAQMLSAGDIQTKFLENDLLQLPETKQ